MEGIPLEYLEPRDVMKILYQQCNKNPTKSRVIGFL